MTATASQPTLVQAIGRWSFAGLVLNTIIGTGVFVLTGTLGASLGWYSMLAWLVGAALTYPSIRPATPPTDRRGSHGARA